MQTQALVRSVAASCFILSSACAALPPFNADLGRQTVGSEEHRDPYTSVTRYFGYIAPNAQADETRDGKKMFYLYMWIPAVSPEIGVRMLSPVKEYGVTPNPEKDFVDPAYAEHADETVAFDTWVRFERCLAAVNPEDIAKPCQQWVTFGENDDSAELPANAQGQQVNSLLRVSTNTDDPLKALVRGLYRVGFTAFKAGEVQGTFLAEVGAPIELPGTAIARTPAELNKTVDALRHNAAISLLP